MSLARSDGRASGGAHALLLRFAPSTPRTVSRHCDRDVRAHRSGGNRRHRGPQAVRSRSLGVETQLVIYPGQYHGIKIPSYRVDRIERYIAWFDRFLKATTE